MAYYRAERSAAVRDPIFNGHGAKTMVVLGQVAVICLCFARRSSFRAGFRLNVDEFLDELLPRDPVADEEAMHRKSLSKNRSKVLRITILYGRIMRPRFASPSCPKMTLLRLMRRWVKRSLWERKARKHLKATRGLILSRIRIIIVLSQSQALGSACLLRIDWAGTLDDPCGIKEHHELLTTIQDFWDTRLTHQRDNGFLSPRNAPKRGGAAGPKDNSIL